ncbi:MAG TPA: phosphate ABC transporter permease PstA [Aeromicrobium sp.]|nr:phosphate ABC transporter permease PstA [Aeromicrobium sp.]
MSTSVVRPEPAIAQPPTKTRALATVTAEDRFVELGSWVGGFALAWLLNTKLLPWSGGLALALTTIVAGLVVLAVATSITEPRPVVVDRVVAALIHVGALIVGLALLSTIVFILVRGFAALPHVALLTQDMSGVGPRDDFNRGGILHAIVGSLIQVGIAIVITVPLGIGTAVFMTEVGGKYARIVRTVVEAMTALPSIVAGLFIYTVMIVTLGLSRSGLAASLALAVMMLPIIARASDVVLSVVPGGLREASLALGASRWRTVWHVVLPTARPGLATAQILGVARGIGETSPVLLTSGAAGFLVLNPTDGVMNSLPLFIYTTVRSGEPMYIARAFAAATVLLFIVLILFVMTRYLARPRKGSR